MASTGQNMQLLIIVTKYTYCDTVVFDYIPFPSSIYPFRDFATHRNSVEQSGNATDLVQSRCVPSGPSSNNCTSTVPTPCCLRPLRLPAHSCNWIVVCATLRA